MVSRIVRCPHRPMKPQHKYSMTHALKHSLITKLLMLKVFSSRNVSAIRKVRMGETEIASHGNVVLLCSWNERKREYAVVQQYCALSGSWFCHRFLMNSTQNTFLVRRMFYHNSMLKLLHFCRKLNTSCALKLHPPFQRKVALKSRTSMSAGLGDLVHIFQRGFLLARFSRSRRSCL